MIEDIVVTEEVPRSGENRGNQALVYSNIRLAKALGVPIVEEWTLNGAKESGRYIAFNSTLGVFGFYAGDGVWQTFASFLSTADLSSVQSVGNFIYGIIDANTGEAMTLSKINALPVGIAIDNILFFSIRGEYYQRVVPDSQYRPEWWGAKGDAVTDDTVAFQSAITLIHKIGGGDIRLKSAIYLCSPIRLMKGVNLIGAGFQVSATQPTPLVYNGESVIRCKDIGTVYDVFIDYIPDNTFTSQIGLVSGLPKSNPQSCIQNVVVDGNFCCKVGIELLEAWGNSLINIRAINARMYNVYVFDCNEFLIRDSSINCLLNYSGADYIIEGCNLYGSDKLPPYFSALSANGVVNGNLIYYSPRENNQLSYKIVSLAVDGTFTLEQMNTGNPGWQISPIGSTNGSFSYDEITDTTDMVSFNGLQFSIVSSTLDRLNPGQTYTLTFDVILLNSSVSANRTLRSMSGNQQQTYGTRVLTKNVAQSVSQTFVFNPANPATNPLKFLLDGVTIAGDDTVRITNLNLQSASADIATNKMPFIFYSNVDFPADMQANFDFKTPYFIKFLSVSTFKLYSTRKNYDLDICVVPSLAIPVISDLFISPPKAAFALIGSQSDQGVSSNTMNTGNKIEDLNSDGVLIRGGYAHSFSATNITKAIGNIGVSRAVRLEYGAIQNVFGASFIGSRNLLNTIDDIDAAISIDKYSSQNNFTGITTGTGNKIDIVDEFIGEAVLSNRYDPDTIDNCYSSIGRPSNYLPNRKATIFKTATINNLSAINGVIADVEFTMVFSDLLFLTSTGDSVFFVQNVPGTTTSGRVYVKRDINGAIIILVSGTIVYQSANGVLPINVPKDVAITRNIGYVYSVYVNGVSLTPLSTSVVSTATPTGSTVRTLVGSDTLISDTYSISRFRYFSDLLSTKEITTLFSSKFLDKNITIAPPILNQAVEDIQSGLSTGITFTTGASSGYLGTKGLTCQITASDHVLVLKNTSTLTPLRISFYIVTSNPELITTLLGTRYEISVIEKISSTTLRITLLVNPVLVTSSTTFKFGIKTLQGFTVTVSPASSGTVIISNLKVYSSYIPCVVDVDMTAGKNGIFKNRISSTQFADWRLLDDYNYITKLGSAVSDYSLDLSAEFIPNTASMAVYINGVSFNNTSYNRTTKILSGLPETTGSDIIQIML